MDNRKPRRILVSFRLLEALGQVLGGIGEYVKRRQLHWQIHCVEADEFVSGFKPAAIDGAITVISPRSNDQIARIRRGGVPVVNMLHDLHPTLPSVLSDDAAIGHTAARYLLTRGFRHFGFLGFDTRWSHDRLRGFSETLAEAGRHCEACPHYANVADHRVLARAGSATRLKRWLEKLPKPVAVLACSDPTARPLLMACGAARLRVPHEVAVLGVDNLVATCELAPVPLSSVAQDFHALGFEAARLLDRAMSAKPSSKRSAAYRILVPPGNVIDRRSTDVLAFDDEYVSAAMRMIHGRGPSGVSIADILREVPVSRRWLDARFTDVVGHTPSVEIRRVKIARVKEMLTHTDLSIKQVAIRCGFSCPENMIRLFKHETAFTPRRFREGQTPHV